jgi:antitoxin ParD1/3/4
LRSSWRHAILDLVSRISLTMNVSIGDRWQEFVERAVQSGRYASASEVVREGLRLVEEREAKLKALTETLNASIAEGRGFTDAEVAAAIDAQSDELVRQGF